jgi:hypothetical protein
MVDGSRDQDLRSALDRALRDMMSAANELPVPDSLIEFVEALTDEEPSGEG